MMGEAMLRLLQLEIGNEIWLWSDKYLTQIVYGGLPRRLYLRSNLI